MKGDSSAGSNIDRLRDEGGFLIKTPLPPAYADVIEDLDDDQISLLISIKSRFDEAEAETPPEVAHYSAYFLMPPF